MNTKIKIDTLAMTRNMLNSSVTQFILFTLFLIAFIAVVSA